MTPRAGSKRGGGAATAAAWAGPCSHHLGDTEGTGDSSRSAKTCIPPPRLQPRRALTMAPGLSPAGCARKAPRTLRSWDAEAQTSCGWLPVGWSVVAAERQLPKLPGVEKWGEEDAAAGGSDGRRGTPELRREQQRLKFLLSRCLFSGSIACGFPPPAGPKTPSFLSLLPDPRIFKGAARYFSCFTLRSPDVGLASSAH